MTGKSQIIVLNTVKYGDSGIIIQCYSNTYGRLSIYVKGTGKNKNYRNYLHRLNILDIEIFEKGDKMPLLKEMSPVRNFDSIRTDIHKNAIAIFICELLLKGIKEVEANEQLYKFIELSINALETCKKGTANFPAYFLVHFCDISGFRPLDNYRDGQCLFDISSASYIVKQQGDCDAVFSNVHSQMLHNLLNTPFEALHSIKSNGETRYEFTKKMLEYLSYHLGSVLELKSLDVLHEINSENLY